MGRSVLLTLFVHCSFLSTYVVILCVVMMFDYVIMLMPVITMDDSGSVASEACAGLYLSKGPQRSLLCHLHKLLWTQDVILLSCGPHLLLWSSS